MPICPVCKSELKTITERHINSNKHQEALKELNPALDFLDKNNELEEEGEEEVNIEEKEELELEIKEEKIVEKIEEETEEFIEEKELAPETSPKTSEKLKMQPFKLSVQIPTEEKIEAKVQREDKGFEYPTEKEIDLFIPAIPEPKKMKKLDTSTLTVGVLEKLSKLESDNVNAVLVNCQRCNEVIPIPIPKNMILNSDLPVVAVSYIHKNKIGNDQHCLTLYLDHDFDIRRQRISEVILESDKDV